MTDPCSAPLLGVRVASYPSALVLLPSLGYAGGLEMEKTMDISEFPHVKPPFSHQTAHLSQHCDATSWALLWEQGTANKKPIIDTA